MPWGPHPHPLPAPNPHNPLKTSQGNTQNIMPLYIITIKGYPVLRDMGQAARAHKVQSQQTQAPLDPAPPTRTLPHEDCGLSSISCVSLSLTPAASASALPHEQFLHALRPLLPTSQSPGCSATQDEAFGGQARAHTHTQTCKHCTPSD